MSNKNLTIWLTVVTIIAVLAWFFPVALAVPPTAGSTGSRFPDGISANTTSPVAGQVLGTTLTTTGLATLASAAVTGILSVATSTPSSKGDVVVESIGTTTLMLSSSSTTAGSCLQMENSLGAPTAAYINVTTWVLVAGYCR